MAGLGEVIKKLQKTNGFSESTAASVVQAEAKKTTPVNRNARKAAAVSQLAVYKTVQFTYVHGSRKGQVVFMKQSSFNVKRLGIVESPASVVTKEVTRGGVKSTIVVKEHLVMTKSVQVSIGRGPKKRKAATKGGRALRGGGKSVGGGTTQFAKTWVTIPVPKNSTAMDILAHAETFKKDVYEIRYDGSSISVKPYKTTVDKRA
jgi:hypothetical protein